MTERIVVLELARLEAAHLAGLVRQFAELLDDPGEGDPAIERLVPAAYEDEDDAREFRELTEAGLLERRRTDAEAMLTTLHTILGPLPDDPADPALVEAVTIPLDAAAAQSWLRTLAAVRLVLASRLGIERPEDHDPDDPRFGIYEWLGFRLDGLVQALDDRS